MLHSGILIFEKTKHGPHVWDGNCGIADDMTDHRREQGVKWAE